MANKQTVGEINLTDGDSVENVEIESQKPAESTVEENTNKKTSEGETPKEDESASNNTEESVDDLKERLSETEKERDNYKEAVLISKKKDREISEEVTLSKEEKKKLGEDGVKAAESSRKNEKEAVSKFIEDNQEYVDDEKWQSLVANFNTPKNSSVEDFSRALQNAHIVSLHESGELVTQEDMNEKIKKAQTDIQVNKIAGSNGSLGSGSNTIDKSNTSAQQMSGRFKHSDPEAVAKLGDSNVAVIDITK